jgi:hypothetical protein
MRRSPCQHRNHKPRIAKKRRKPRDTRSGQSCSTGPPRPRLSNCREFVTGGQPQYPSTAKSRPLSSARSACSAPIDTPSSGWDKDLSPSTSSVPGGALFGDEAKEAS